MRLPGTNSEFIHKLAYELLKATDGPTYPKHGIPHQLQTPSSVEAGRSLGHGKHPKSDISESHSANPQRGSNPLYYLLLLNELVSEARVVFPRIKIGRKVQRLHNTESESSSGRSGTHVIQGPNHREDW